MKWQPIESVPKGRKVLARDTAGTVGAVNLAPSSLIRDGWTHWCEMPGEPDPAKPKQLSAEELNGSRSLDAIELDIKAIEERTREIVDYEQSQLPEGYSTNAQGDLTGDHDRILDYEDIEGQIGTMCTDGCDPHALHAWLSARLGK